MSEEIIMDDTKIQKESEDVIVEVEDSKDSSLIEVEETPVEVEASPKDNSDTELEDYSEGVRKRIKKLTEKFRKEERDKEESVRMTQQLLQENNNLKGRMKQLDSGYLSQYGAKVDAQLNSARRAYKEAYESGDSDAILKNSVQFAKSNIPGINLFYTKTALDYLFIHGMMEHVNPGYLRRMERRMKKDTDQTFYFPPSQTAVRF